MNPNGGEKAPQPAEYAPDQPGAHELAGRSTEKLGAATPENAPQKQSIQLSSQRASDLAIPAATTSSGAQAADDNRPQPKTDDKASDGDRIEKEWIDKAKAVISKTQDDPFEQKEAMSQVKADYIKKRFNKTVKTKTDSSAR